MTSIAYIGLHLICIIPAYLAMRIYHKMTANIDTLEDVWTKRSQTKAIIVAIAGSWALLFMYGCIFVVTCIIYVCFFIYSLIRFFIFIYECFRKDGVSLSSVKWNEEVSW